MSTDKNKCHWIVAYEYVLQSHACFWSELYVIQSTRNTDLVLDATHLCNFISSILVIYLNYTFHDFVISLLVFLFLCYNHIIRDPLKAVLLSLSGISSLLPYHPIAAARVDWLWAYMRKVR